MAGHSADTHTAAPARADFIGLSRPDIGDEEIEEILQTLRSGWLTSGPRVRMFQQDLADYLDAAHVRCLSSCTAGLMLALRLAGVGPGDEVILPAITFVACANVVEHAGARPVFVDVDPATGLIDLDAADAAVGPRTKAIMPVHLGGRPVDLDRVDALSRRHDLVVIEDAAHAIGAEWRGRRIGSHGHLCSFSFHATKNMTTFEGGALVVGDAEQAARVERLAMHGLSRTAWSRHASASADRYEVVEPGFKLALNDVGAAAGIHQLRRLDGWIERRASLAAAYDELLAELPLDLPPDPTPGMRHAHHLYMVGVRDDAARSREEIVQGLQERQVGSSVHFRGLHLFEYYRERYQVAPESLPAANEWSGRALTLPLHPALSDDDVAYVADALGELLRS